VAHLRLAQLVAAANHRHALGEQQGSDKVALLPLPQRRDGGGAGRPPGAAGPGGVLVWAVAGVLVVGLGGLVVVAGQVLEREAVVARDEVDARVGAAAALLVQVAAAGEPGGEFRDRAAVALPELADAVAVLAVPLRPAGGEVADLVAARPD